MFLAKKRAVFLLIAIPTIYVEVNKVTYKNRVMNYLVAEKGYHKEEIKGVGGKGEQIEIIPDLEK